MSATGERVRVHTVTAHDLAPYRVAVQASAQRLGQWNPVDPEDLARHLAAQSTAHRTFLVHALDAEGGHGIVGKVNVTNVVRGRFQNATIGYDSYDPYVGRGLLAEGLRLIVTLAFTAEPRGMGLHRIEANVQPGNINSAGLLRSLGFRREGHIPGMLWLLGADGQTQWRDHDCHAITADEWPARPYAPHRPRRVVVVVNGIPSAGKTTLARRLAAELGVPLLSGAVLGSGLWQVLADSPAGGVLDLADVPNAAYEAGLKEAAVEASGVLRVRCAPGAGAGGRERTGEVRCDPGQPVTDREITSIALAARAISPPSLGC
ncbi:GNAT family N-acetyltransferase [Dermacoccaceae bacterium W4C1]